MFLRGKMGIYQSVSECICMFSHGCLLKWYNIWIFIWVPPGAACCKNSTHLSFCSCWMKVFIKWSKCIKMNFLNPCFCCSGSKKENLYIKKKTCWKRPSACTRADPDACARTLHIYTCVCMWDVSAPVQVDALQTCDLWPFLWRLRPRRHATSL